jgi:hypothetical protein
MDPIMKSAVEVAEDSARDVVARIVAVRAGLAVELASAAEAVVHDPEGAALALDGMVWRMLRAWYGAQGLPQLGAGEMLADLDRRAPELARGARLALRPPDPAARLAHARQLLSVLAAELHECASAEELSAYSGIADLGGQCCSLELGSQRRRKAQERRRP